MASTDMDLPQVEAFLIMFTSVCVFISEAAGSVLNWKTEPKCQKYNRPIFGFHIIIIFLFFILVITFFCWL